MASGTTETWQSMPIPTPFIFGFSLTPDQLRTVAHKWLPDDNADKLEDDRSYHVALVRYFRKKGFEWTVLDTRTSSGEQRFLWVTHVIPIWNWDGTNPKPQMPAENIARVQSKFGLKSVETMCQLWPPGMSPPDWLIRKVIEKGKEISQEKRKKAEQGKERAA
ncbi:hypothetical protein B0H14DRAFT_2699398 [Mycena olivaceomarginata]|nr:hypothetical protein B0H14DRAFT_2699398 [Mycena olivaceomarginata]